MNELTSCTALSQRLPTSYFINLSAPLTPQNFVQIVLNDPYTPVQPEDIQHFLATMGQAIDRLDIESYVCLAYVLLRTENLKPKASSQEPQFTYYAEVKQMIAVLLQATSVQPTPPTSVQDLILEYLTPLGDAFPAKHLFWLLTCLQWVTWHYNEKFTLTTVPDYLQVLNGLPPIKQEKIDVVIPLLHQVVEQYHNVIVAMNKPFAVVLAYPPVRKNDCLLPSFTMARSESSLAGNATACAATSLAESVPAAVTSAVLTAPIEGVADDHFSSFTRLPRWKFNESLCIIGAANGRTTRATLKQFQLLRALLAFPPGTPINIKSLPRSEKYNDFENFRANNLYRPLRKVKTDLGIFITTRKINDLFFIYSESSNKLSMSPSTFTEPRLQSGLDTDAFTTGWRLNPRLHEVTATNGRSVRLSPRQYSVLAPLLLNPNQFFYVQELLENSGYGNYETLYMDGIHSAQLLIEKATHLFPIIQFKSNTQGSLVWHDGRVRAQLSEPVNHYLNKDLRDKSP